MPLTRTSSGIESPGITESSFLECNCIINTAYVATRSNYQLTTTPSFPPQTILPRSEKITELVSQTIYSMRLSIAPLSPVNSPRFKDLINHQINDLINLPLFSTVVPAIIFVFLSCRPFVVNTFSTGLVSVAVSSVSWLGQLTVGVITDHCNCWF